MKTIIATMLSLLIVTTSANADVNDEIKNEISDLKNKISLQNDRINSLDSKINEVSKQNLALKENLRLKPTIAEAKSEASVLYKLIEAKGNVTDSLINLVIIVENLSETDEQLGYLKIPTFTDENGIIHESNQCMFTLGGIKMHQGSWTAIPNVPLRMEIGFDKINPNIQYVKLLRCSVGIGVNSFRMFNIPIKWE